MSRFLSAQKIRCLNRRCSRFGRLSFVIVFFICGFFVFFSYPSVSRAAGMFFYSVMSSGDNIEATKQRAVLWERDQIWELHIQPYFDRGRGSGVWVVPFTVYPEVSASSHEFLDQMEILTAPVFLSYCSFPVCGPADDADGGGDFNTGEITGMEADIQVWEEGSVGDLDFSIISTVDGDSLANWLTDRGYKVPAEWEPFLETYDNEGAFFFIARLQNTVDPEKPLLPVRFQLPGLYPPLYPLRMTSLGVSDGNHADLSLWVVFQRESGFVPSSHDFAVTGGEVDSLEGYLDSVVDFFEQFPGKLSVSTSANFGSDERFRDMDLFQLYHRSVGSFDLAGLGIAPPAEWSPEILEIQNSASWVFKYRAFLGPDALVDDLRFRSVPTGDLPANDNLYIKNDGYCSSCEKPKMLKGCTVAAFGGRGSSLPCLLFKQKHCFGREGVKTEDGHSDVGMRGLEGMLWFFLMFMMFGFLYRKKRTNKTSQQVGLIENGGIGGTG